MISTPDREVAFIAPRAPLQRKKQRTTFWPRLANSFRKRVSAVTHPLLITGLRFIERSCGISAAERAVGLMALLDLIKRLPDYAHFKKIRARLALRYRQGATDWSHYQEMVFNWNSSMATLLLADRLREPGWDARIRNVGLPLDRLAGWGKRPFTLVFLHTGGFPILRHWLRAQGFPAISYVASVPEILKHPRARAIYAAADKQNGLEGLRHMFDGSRDLLATRKFLVPGNILTMALDAGTAAFSPEVFQIDGQEIQLHSGAVRLAASSGASLVPVSILNRGALRFDLRFGVPVPQSLIDAASPRPALQFLLEDLWTDVEQVPTSLGWTTLEALTPDLRKKHQPWP